MHAYILLLLLQLVYVLTELYYIFSCFSRELCRLFLIEPGLVVIVVVARLRSLCFDEEEEARSSYFLGIVRVNDIREEYFKAKQQNEKRKAKKCQFTFSHCLVHFYRMEKLFSILYEIQFRRKLAGRFEIFLGGILKPENKPSTISIG